MYGWKIIAPVTIIDMLVHFIHMPAFMPISRCDTTDHFLFTNTYDRGLRLTFVLSLFFVTKYYLHPLYMMKPLTFIINSNNMNNFTML